MCETVFDRFFLKKNFKKAFWWYWRRENQERTNILDIQRDLLEQNVLGNCTPDLANDQ